MGVARLLGRAIFATRWLLAPFYLGLIVALGVLLVKFARQVGALGAATLTASAAEITIGVLSLIELSLLANLLLMVIVAGYESFVARIEMRDEDRLSWMGQVGFGELKLKLIASIAAIAAVQLLEDFMEVGQLSDRELAWSTGLLLAFVVAGLLLAAMDRISD